MEPKRTFSQETQERVISKRAESKGRRTVAEKAQQLGRLKIEYLSVDDIKPNRYNPNRQSEHDFELLLGSIEDDGFTQPVIVNMEGVIVDGEHRWRAAQVLGMKEIPVVRVEMNEDQMRISTIRHNRARGSHDIDLEAEVLKELQELGSIDWAQEALGLDDTELNTLLNDISAPEALAGEQFEEGWIPEKFSEEDKAALREGRSAVNDSQTISTTKAAADAQRRREKLIKEAKTEQDRKQARQETAVFRVSCFFSGDESELVKRILGEHHADKILELCHREAERLKGEQ